jgi:beta-glucosidase
VKPKQTKPHSPVQPAASQQQAEPVSPASSVGHVTSNASNTSNADLSSNSSNSSNSSSADHSSNGPAETTATVASTASTAEHRFPAGFVFGVATSAYQVEGAAAEDGRGPSIWDTFSRTPGKVTRGETGDVATEHYHRYREDVALMADLGVTAYRFSVSWPRVQADGMGPANPPGLDFYKRLVDALLEAGIEPWPTLYHWDLPQPLEDLGGWPERDTAYRFAEYAGLVGEALGDRVHNWFTINEPWCAGLAGYASGEHAPGRREPKAAVRAVHHLLLAHGLAAGRLRGPGQRVGAALNLYPVDPAGGHEADIDAARRIDGLQNRLFLDPVMLGRYPDDVVADLSRITDFDHVHDGDLATIATGPDLLGINYYSRFTVSGLPGEHRAATSSPHVTGSPWVGSEHVRFVGGGRPVTAMGWEIDPHGLFETLTRVAGDYPPVPLYVTENGAAFDDTLSRADGADGTDGAGGRDGAGGGGAVHDTRRLEYVREHLRACHSAIAAGVPLHGYFAWSLMDNFEWAWGYAKRFGLVYVDFATQERLLKDSARWYAGVISRRALPGRTQ